MGKDLEPNVRVPKIFEYIYLTSYYTARGITRRPSMLNLVRRSCEGHRAFAVAIAYGIQLLEREPRNVAD